MDCSSRRRSARTSAFISSGLPKWMRPKSLTHDFRYRPNCICPFERRAYLIEGSEREPTGISTLIIAFSWLLTGTDYSTNQDFGDALRVVHSLPAHVLS